LLTVESDGSQRFWLVVRREFDLPCLAKVVTFFNPIAAGTSGAAHVEHFPIPVWHKGNRMKSHPGSGERIYSNYEKFTFSCWCEALAAMGCHDSIKGP